jgi:hypothetical protein
MRITSASPPNGPVANHKSARAEGAAHAEKRAAPRVAKRNPFVIKTEKALSLLSHTGK